MTKEFGLHLADSLSIATLIATFFDWLPHITALVSLIWVLIRVYETKTVQKLLGKHDTSVVHMAAQATEDEL